MIHETRPTAPPAIRVAGVLVGLEGLGGLAFVAALVVLAINGEAQTGGVLAQAVFFLLISGAVLVASTGLVTGRRWARTPAIVVQLLLLPVVYTLIGPNRQLLAGVLTGAVVITAFLLLISERSRRWSAGVDDPEPDAGPDPEPER